MKIVIKTKNRVQKLMNKTYTSIIQKYHLDENSVHLFVSTKKDLDDYSVAFPKCKVILGPPGIAAIDNFIVDYFDEGEIYLYMNDDVSGIYEVVDKKTTRPVKNLKKLLDTLIKTCLDNNLTYGGFYPVCNPFYMYKQKPVRLDLSLVMDPLSICINNKDVKLTEIKFKKEDGSVFIGESSDSEKCIQHYKSRGGIVRFNRYSPKVEYYGKQGGYQGRNAYTEDYTAKYLMNKYPEYISGIKYKKNGMTSIRLIPNPSIHIQIKNKQIGAGKHKPTYKRDSNGICRFVISLDNEVGKKRRTLLNYEYNLFRGIKGVDCPDWIVEKMKHRSNIQDKNKMGKLGCWASYATLLQKIINEKINNVLILEDDCIQVSNTDYLPPLGDKPIYLNGYFHHPTNYTKRNKEWIRNVKKNLPIKKGINAIRWDKIRIVGTWGVFIPRWEQAYEILFKLANSKTYTTVDSQLSKHHIIDRFYYPSLFKHSDNRESSISNGLGEVRYWTKNEMDI